MLNEILINTRSSATTKDYIWLGGDPNLSWTTKYRSLVNEVSNDVNLLIEIDRSNYRVYLSKLNCVNRKDSFGRPTYYILAAEGVRGSSSSVYLTKLLKNYILNPDMVAKKFEETLTGEFVDAVYDNADADILVQNKLSEINWDEIQCQDSHLLIDNQFVFDYYYDNNDVNDSVQANRHSLCCEVSKISNNDFVDKTISLILTQEAIEEKYFDEFDYLNSNFSQGLCLSMSEESDSLPIKKLLNCQLILPEGIGCKSVFCSLSDRIELSVTSPRKGYKNRITANGKIVQSNFSIFDLGISAPEEIIVDCVQEPIQYGVFVDGVFVKNCTINDSFDRSFPKEKNGTRFKCCLVNDKKVECNQLSVKISDYVDDKTTEIRINSEYEKIPYRITCSGCKVSKNEAFYGDHITIDIPLNVSVDSISINGVPYPTNTRFFTMPDKNVNVVVTKKVLSQIRDIIIRVWDRIKQWTIQTKAWVTQDSTHIILTIVGLILLLMICWLLFAEN